MFNRRQYTLISNPTCYASAERLDPIDFQYYDKDGFELNIAEQKYYTSSNFPINNTILNHTCWQEPWFELEDNIKEVILDHSMFLCRAKYAGKAKEQLKKLSKFVPQANLLLNTKSKWGFDFALDSVKEGQVFEVLHIEYDSNCFDKFNEEIIKFEYLVRHTDWVDAAKKVWDRRSEWQHLKGFDQNHWKAKFLINWNLSEYTEKAI